MIMDRQERWSRRSARWRSGRGATASTLGLGGRHTHPTSSCLQNEISRAISAASSRSATRRGERPRCRSRPRDATSVISAEARPRSRRDRPGSIRSRRGRRETPARGNGFAIRRRRARLRRQRPHRAGRRSASGPRRPHDRLMQINAVVVRITAPTSSWAWPGCASPPRAGFSGSRCRRRANDRARRPDLHIRPSRGRHRNRCRDAGAAGLGSPPPTPIMAPSVSSVPA